jgi:hypothetical protein
MPTGGGPVSTLASGLDVEDIAINSTYAFAGDFDGFQGNAIYRVPLAGGGQTVIGHSPLQTPTRFAADETSVYWFAGDQNTLSIFRVPADGSAAPVALASPTDFGAGTPILQGGVLYWASTTGIYSLSTQGGPIVTLRSASMGIPLALLPDGSQMYFWSSAQIMSAPPGGGTPIAIAELHGYPQQFALDSTDLYYSAGPQVGTVPLAGGTPSPLVDSMDPTLVINRMVLDSDNIYLAINGSNLMLPTGSIMQLTKK